MTKLQTLSSGRLALTSLGRLGICQVVKPFPLNCSAGSCSDPASIISARVSGFADDTAGGTYCGDMNGDYQLPFVGPLSGGCYWEYTEGVGPFFDFRLSLFLFGTIQFAEIMNNRVDFGPVLTPPYFWQFICQLAPPDDDVEFWASEIPPPNDRNLTNLCHPGPADHPPPNENYKIVFFEGTEIPALASASFPEVEGSSELDEFFGA